MTPPDPATLVPAWLAHLPVAVTVAAADGTILYLNERAAETFAAQGGHALVGQDLYACHNERSRAILRDLLATGRANTYTIEKNGRKKLIHQAPWTEDGKVAGLVELSVVLPAEVPHFVRGQGAGGVIP